MSSDHDGHAVALMTALRDYLADPTLMQRAKGIGSEFILRSLEEVVTIVPLKGNLIDARPEIADAQRTIIGPPTR